MVHRLAVQDHMIIAEAPEHPFGKLFVAHFGFLQTQNIGRFLGQETLDDVEAGTDAVNIPADDFQTITHAEPDSHARTETQAQRRPGGPVILLGWKRKTPTSGGIKEVGANSRSSRMG
jgi:hypothetical protein